jgi:organic hydroperoxide reductase OsmC/OhrA
MEGKVMLAVYAASGYAGANVTSPARELADAAHGICPYSKATRGNIDVETTSR